MKIQSEIITQFLENLPTKYKTPLDTIIIKMLESSKYIDDSTLIYDENNEWKQEHYHNWDCNPIEISELKNITKKEYSDFNDIELTTLLNKHLRVILNCCNFVK